MYEPLTSGDYFSSALPQPSHVAVKMINSAIRRLFSQGDLDAKLAANEDTGVFVCDATEDQWRHYVKSESQALKSRAMVWRLVPGPSGDVRRGKVYIVELPTTLHEDVGIQLLVAVSLATGTGVRHLVGHGASYLKDLGDLREPDHSFGPHPRVIGAALPPEIRNWADFHTLKVEIGVSQGWTQLLEKAAHWATITGVVYVLLIRISPGMEVREYGLLEVQRPVAVPPTPPIAPVLFPLVAPRTRIQADPPTTIQLDARRLLSLQPGDALPAGFVPTGVLVVNLGEVVEEALSTQT